MTADVRDLDFLERVIVDVQFKNALAEGVRLRGVLKDVVLMANWDGFASNETRVEAIEKAVLSGLNSENRYKGCEDFEKHVYETVQEDYSPEFEARVKRAVRKAGLPK